MDAQYVYMHIQNAQYVYMHIQRGDEIMINVYTCTFRRRMGECSICIHAYSEG